MGLEKENIYFIGIGGIGMSALARYFHQKGKNVSGYDRMITKLTKQLQTEGISITNIDRSDAIPFAFQKAENTTIVYTPAIPDENEILSHFKEENFNCYKRAEILGLLSKGMKTIAVAGTHGKTTISTMLAYIFSYSSLNCNAFLGGISRNLRTNMLLDPKAEWMISEADEFDRSFLQLHAQDVIITSMDCDHMDIYEDEADVYSTYNKFVSQMNEDGLLMIHHAFKDKINSKKRTLTYALNNTEKANVFASNVEVVNGKFSFTYHSKYHTIEEVICGLPGLHNIENALAAITLALDKGITPKKIKEAIANFLGVQRRFDVHLSTDKIVYIDDYAHHPTEIDMLVKSVRQLYPEKKISAIFQPHLFSRTKDFGDEFGKSLAQIDDLILLEIYPAREEPIEGINSLWLSKKIGKNGIHVCEKHHIMKILKSKDIELLLTIGAGDIDTLVHPIINYLESRF